MASALSCQLAGAVSGDSESLVGATAACRKKRYFIGSGPVHSDSWALTSRSRTAVHVVLGYSFRLRSCGRAAGGSKLESHAHHSASSEILMCFGVKGESFEVFRRSWHREASTGTDDGRPGPCASSAPAFGSGTLKSKTKVLKRKYVTCYMHLNINEQEHRSDYGALAWAAQ